MPTVYADASQNNEIGLPLTVLRLEPETRVLVTEMGMRGLGQIAELCAIARPHLALVTAIGPEHLELVGTVDGRRACERRGDRGAARRAVSPSSRPTPRSSSRISTAVDVEIRRFDSHDLERAMADSAARRVRAGASGSVACELELELPFEQRHLAENVLAALTAYDALGLPLERAQEGAAQIRLSPLARRGDRAAGGRLRRQRRVQRQSRLDARGAARSRPSARGTRRRVAVLGEMAELGDESERYHREIGELLADAPLDVLVAVGEPARAYLEPGVAEMHWIPDAGAFAHGRRRRSSPATRCSSRPRGPSVSKASRRRSRRSSGMVRVLIAGLVAMVIAVVIGPQFIEWLRRQSIGQQIREEGPAGHHGQGGHADDGRPAHPLRRGAPVPRPLHLHGPGLTMLGATARLRR